MLLTGRLSPALHPWLADHRVGGVVFFPGTGFLELAVRAGDEVGCDRVDELTLEAPLVLADGAFPVIQVWVGAPRESGGRAVTIYSRPEDATDQPWTRHASGVLSAGERVARFDEPSWPPANAVAVESDGFYANSQYGPAFQDLRSVWLRDDEVFAEVALGDDIAGDAQYFGLHPALLDAVMHANPFAGVGDEDRFLLPFSWSGVSLHARGASVLRVRLVRAAEDSVSIAAVDAAGGPVLSVESLALRAISAPVPATRRAGGESLLRVEWMPAPEVRVAEPPACVSLGSDPHGIGATIGSLAEASGREQFVLVPIRGAGDDVPATVHELTAHALRLVQEWIAADRFADARLVFVSRQGVSTGAGDPVRDLAANAVWGLVRSAQSENPDRFVLLDVDLVDVAGLLPRLPGLLATGDSQFVVRGGEVRIGRLARLSGAPSLLPPADDPWRLAPGTQGRLGDLALVPYPEVTVPLGARHVRVAVRAAGLNFRDVLVALGMYPGEVTVIGSEAAGVVVEVGSEVRGLRVGDRVMGLIPGGLATVAMVDERLVVPVPEGCSWEQAATLPMAFATAWYALNDLAELRAGESILVHAGAGGVGMAAIRIARHLGAEVFATASEGKWDALRELGVADDHIASSRTVEFEQRFLAATGGRGVDVVLNSLSGEFVDASVRATAAGGRFVEMGKTDLRDPASFQRLTYRSFDVSEAGPDRLREILTEIAGLVAAGALTPSPVTTWDVRQAREAFRHMSQARHVGKIALTMPAVWDDEGHRPDHRWYRRAGRSPRQAPGGHRCAAPGADQPARPGRTRCRGTGRRTGPTRGTDDDRGL